MTSNYLSQNTEIDLLKRLIPYLSNKNFIDIGAENGVFSLSMLELGMSGVLFEPMPRHFSTLEILVKNYKDVRLYTCAITNIDTRQSFNVAMNDAGQELDYFHSLQKADANGIFSHSSSFEVQCRSLESLNNHSEIPSDIGVLKTDTEGNDLNVLRGLGKLRPEVIICEFFTKGLYNGWSEGSPELIIDYMFGIGYKHFLTIKRIGDLEFMGIGMALYDDKQWGNLFFFRDDFYEKSKSTIAECVLSSEQELIRKFNEYSVELEEKEKNISIFKEAADERLQLIENLTNVCKEREEVINELSLQLNFYKKNFNNESKSFLEKIKERIMKWVQ